MQNYLSKNRFLDQADFKVFKKLVNILDYMDVKYVSRELYNSKNWEILEAKDNKKDSYTLYLPTDLKIWEKIEIIRFLIRKFKLEDDIQIEDLIWNIKIMVLNILKSWKLEWKDYLNDLSKKYNFSQDLIEEITNHKLKPTKENRNFIKKSWLNKKQKSFLSKIEDWSYDLSKEIMMHFDLLFFRKSIERLRNEMKTITQQEQQKLIDNYESRWFEKDILIDWKISYTKWKEIIEIHTDSNNLDEKPRLLRDKIWIDELKTKLEKVRGLWNKEEIEKLELEATKKILDILYEYPYQDTKNNYWYQPIKILEEKEIYCVWYSLLWHAFLSELWIKHKWLHFPEHVAIEVIIWWKRYYFDWAKSKDLIEFYIKNVENSIKKDLVDITSNQVFYEDTYVNITDIWLELLWEITFNSWLYFQN